MLDTFFTINLHYLLVSIADVVWNGLNDVVAQQNNFYTNAVEGDNDKYSEYEDDNIHQIYDGDDEVDDNTEDEHEMYEGAEEYEEDEEDIESEEKDDDELVDSDASTLVWDNPLWAGLSILEPGPQPRPRYP